MDQIKLKLDELRTKFLDTILGVSIIIGIFIQIIVILRDYPDYINSFFYIRIVIICILIFLYSFRRHSSGSLKISLLIFLLFLLFFLSVYNLGFYSTLKLFIVFGPVTLIFLLSRTFTIFMALVSAGIYLYGSWTLMEGKRRYMIPPAELLTDIFHWGTELGFSIFCILSLIIMINKFRIELNQSIIEIDEQNQKLETSKQEIHDFNSNLEKLINEKTQDLKVAVDNMAAQNRELKSQNASIQEYNKEIATATTKLNLVHERVVLSDKLSSLGILTAGVCHEIKNPLNHIYGSAKILESYLEKTSAAPDQLKLVEALNKGVTRIKNIIESLNQFDHTSQNATTWVNLVTSIENCRRILGHLFEPSVKYRFDAGFTVVEMKISADILHQTILNVMQNAIESLGEEGEVSVVLLATNDKAVIEIADNGCGIPDEVKYNVTDPFFTTKSTELHTGLGLYQVQKMMNDIGGKLIIDSEEGRGTIVRLVFPGEVKIKA